MVQAYPLVPPLRTALTLRGRAATLRIHLYIKIKG
jgi:hypothetical protein